MAGDGGGRYGLVRIGMQRSVMTRSGQSRTSELVMTGLPAALWQHRPPRRRKGTLIPSPAHYKHTDSRVAGVGPIETWVAASWDCDWHVHTHQCLRARCVAATGMGYSVGQEFLFR